MCFFFVISNCIIFHLIHVHVDRVCFLFSRFSHALGFSCIPFFIIWYFIPTTKLNLNIIYRKQEDADSQILVQLDVFDEQKSNDEEQLPGIKGVDLNSPLDVFHAIFRQVR